MRLTPHHDDHKDLEAGDTYLGNPAPEGGPVNSQALQRGGYSRYAS
jgi:hypothetical protein